MTKDAAHGEQASGEPASVEIARGSLAVNGTEIAYLESGRSGAPLALLLHGFPDSAWTWRYLMPELASAGFHVVAPFLRGYAPSAVPPDARYQTGALVADAVALHDAFGGGPDAVIVGHDWGAMAAYGAAAFAPARFRRVVASAVPPAGALAQGILTFAQLKRSWYIFFFQSVLAEAVVSMDDMAFIDGLWADWSPGYDATFDVARTKEALGSPERIAAAIGYYRALFDASKHVPELAGEQAATQAIPPQPTLYLHGTKDGCMGVELIGESVLEFLGEGSRLSMVEGGGHFAHLDRREIVNPRIVEFLTA